MVERDPVATELLDLRKQPALAVFLGVALLGFLYSAIRLVAADAGGAANLAAQQALAFTEGHLDLRSFVTPPHDTAYVDGRYYSAFPPFPAVLLMPFVIVFGLSGTKSALLCILLTALSGAVLYRLLQFLGLDRDRAIWLSAAFFLGTGYWFLLMGGRSVYMYNQVVAVTFTVLSLYFVFRPKASPLLAGLCLGLAFLSRQMTVYVIIFLIVVVWINIAGRDRRAFIRPLAQVLIPFVSCVLVYFAFNAARFGSPFETGYRHIALGGFLQERVATHGLFSTAYLPFNFTSMFFNGFDLEFSGDALLTIERISPWGTSILFASPFILMAFFAKGDSALIRAAWVAAALALAHTLLYFNNGWVQTNTNRFALDFLPLMMVLCAWGMKSAPPILWKAAVMWAIGLNFVAHVVLSLMHVGYLDTY